ncbi:hypothetical protein ASG90_15890 [Nocardioides sp. Soil797]|nr:hypothetical protein ASG90_15890 [Nocardioides sp. Soil797]
MHARKSLASVIAIGATALALSMPAAHAAPAAAKVQKVKTSVSFTTYKLNEPKVTFVGKVKAKKGVCEKGRVVKLKQVDQNLRVGKDRTNKKGVWKITFNGNQVHPGKFKMSVAKKVVKKGGKKIVCSATSKKVDIGA